MIRPNKNNCCLIVFISLLIFAIVLVCVFSYLFVFLFAKSEAQFKPLPENLLPTPLVTRIEKTELPKVVIKNIEETSKASLSTLAILKKSEIPVKDPFDLAKQFKGIKNPIVEDLTSPKTYEAGAEKKFWKLDVDSNTYFQTDAILEYITPHLYFWVEKGIEFKRSYLEDLANEFENKIYPTDRKVFGNEKSPGIDQDIHLTILYTKGIGGVGGYFSANDTLPKQIDSYSNETEMFYLSADYTFLNDEFTYGVLAHEFQHMIQSNIDPNESAWISEGLSELAVELNGYDTGGFVYLFAGDPDLQLNYWPGNDQGNSSPHYGASYLFMRYLYHTYGDEAIHELVSSSLNGFDGIDQVYGKLEEINNKPITSEQLFQDWSIANFTSNNLNSAGNEKYGNMSYFPNFLPSESLTCENSFWQERTVNQFGTDYIQIDCGNAYKIEIAGNESINLLPVEPHSGETYFWSNYGDESDMRLSQSFDFSNVKGSIIMNFWTWYDIEKDYDYLYLTASEDGENWKILKTQTCTEENPTGANYGCGLNGKSSEWINESVDLSDYAGKNMTLRFEYVTDMAVNGDGFVIDDISISAINYFTDFEKDQGGWDAEGFVRIKNTLPQIFGISLLKNGSAEPVEKIISTPPLNYEKEISSDSLDCNSIIVISGLTRYTHQPADYRIRITKIN
jgi:immune inhibitor A